MTSLLAFILAGSVGAPIGITQTPEWKAYQDLLAKSDTYRVCFNHLAFELDAFDSPETLLDKQGTLTVRGNRELVLDTSKARIYWDGRTAVSYDRRTNRATRSAHAPSLGTFEDLGLPIPGVPFRNGDWMRSVSSLEGNSAMTRDKETSGQKGWGSDFYVEDIGLTLDYWFDSQSHLLNGTNRYDCGMGGCSITEISFRWDFAPKVPPGFFDAKPIPADELTTVRQTSRFRFLPATGLTDRHGKLTIRWPKGAQGSASVAYGYNIVSTVEGIGASWSTDIRPGNFTVTVQEVVDDMPVVEGHETVVELGAVVSANRKMVDIYDFGEDPILSLPPGGGPVALLPGTYEAREGRTIWKLVIRPGYISRV